MPGAAATDDDTTATVPQPLGGGGALFAPLGGGHCFLLFCHLSVTSSQARPPLGVHP